MTDHHSKGLLTKPKRHPGHTPVMDEAKWQLVERYYYLINKCIKSCCSSYIFKHNLYTKDDLDLAAEWALILTAENWKSSMPPFSVCATVNIRGALYGIFKKNKNRQQRLDRYALQNKPVAVEWRTPYDLVSLTEQCKQVQLLIKCLPKHLGKEIIEYYFKDISCIELSKRYGCTREAVRLRLSKARKILLEFYSGLDEHA